MGFCRRCGEIVPAQVTRCKCGGSAVAPVVHWNQFQDEGGSPDRWARTYVSTKAHKDGVPVPSTQAEQLSTQGIANQRSDANYSPTRSRRLSTPETDGRGSDVKQSPTKPPRRFPRPLSTAGPHFSKTDNGISQHIASTTTQHTPPATKSNAFSFVGSTESSPVDVITSPDNATLAKAYGSILQRPDTLPIHTCARCSSIFPPDATVYPDPQAPHAAGFLCRPCFAAHGGSKGNCADCNREVLTATKEGGFIENSGRVWHKRCFRCNNCHKAIGHAPIVDLYGKPSCSECFDSCLDRKDTPNKKPREPANNMGGMRGRSRESSPALEELSERLGIKRQTSSNTPIVETSNSPSPMRASVSCDGESLRLRGSLGGSRSETPLRQAKISGLSGNSNSVPLCPRTGESTIPTELMTPELSSSSSSSESISSAPSTPSNSPRQSLARNSRDSITPKAKGVLPSLKVASTGGTKCGRCSQSLFSISGDGKIVTVPADKANTPASYHVSCFRCCICGGGFDSNDQRHATFVKDSRGVCHPECITADEYIEPTHSAPQETKYSDCFTDQPPRIAPPLSRPFPRFGGSETCPGCHRPVSLMEYGVVPGPQSSRWHSACLVCGGKGAKLPRPGCGKRLDSAAKTDQDGGVWCRECMLLLPFGTSASPQGSPTRGGLTPSYTGTGIDRFPRPDAGRLFDQVTGNSLGRVNDLLARQYTGGGAGILRRGSVSPKRQMTRSVSPTKGLIPVTRHQRPAASWKHKSVDEGRGMFLVKQMTGNGQN